MPAQTSYEKQLATGLAGMLYDMGNTDIDSFAAEGVVPYGVFCARGTDAENQCVAGGATSIGVSVRTAGENQYPDTGVYDGNEYADKETVGLLRAGYIWAQFDAVGGTVGAVVTINATGEVVVAGGATALTQLTARIEKPAVDATIGTTNVFVGLVKLDAK